MSAEVETMMFVGRERPWHGLGTMVEEAPDSREALIAAGLDWDVYRDRSLHRMVSKCRDTLQMSVSRMAVSWGWSPAGIR